MADDIRLLCTADEWEQLNTIPIHAQPQFHHIFWRARDPDPSTEINERVVDHLNRLLYVKRFCRRFAAADFSIYDPRIFMSYQDIRRLHLSPGKPKSKEHIVDFFNQLYRSILLGDELPAVVNAKNPAWTNRALDDMGLTILRCGMPDIELWSEAQGSLPECSSFMYQRTIFHPELIVHFFFSGDAGWCFSSFPMSIAGRGAINSNYRMLEDELTDFVHLEKETNKIGGYSEKNKIEKFAASKRDKMQSVTNSVDKSVEYIVNHDISTEQSKQMRLDLAPLSYSGHDGKNELDLIYKFNAAQLSFTAKENNQEAHILKKVSIFKKDFTPIHQSAQEQKITTPLSFNTRLSKDYLGILPFSRLPSGNFIIEMQIMDTNSEKNRCCPAAVHHSGLLF